MKKEMHFMLPLLALLLACSSSYAQKYKAPEEDFELARQLSEKYPDDDIVTLNASERYTFSLDKSGKVAAKLEHSEKLLAVKDNKHFSDGIFFDAESEVREIKAYNRKGRPLIVKTATKPYESDGIFHSDVKLTQAILFMDFMGNKMDFEFEKEFKDVKYFTSVYFDAPYPILEKTVRLEVPDWLEVEVKTFNFENGELAGREFSEGKATVYEYKLKNIPAHKRESYAAGASHSLPHLLVLCKSYNKGGETIPLLRSTDDLYAWYRQLVESIDNQPEALKPIVGEITQGLEGDDAKIEALYYWVQDNIRYIAFEDGLAGFKPEAAQKVCENRYGDCKGMANLLKQMLLLAGYDARLAWIGTRQIAYDYSMPSLSVDNHMICAVTANGERHFLDPTEKYIPYKNNAFRIQGRQALVENGDTYTIETIPETAWDLNLSRTNIALEIDGLTLKGKAQSTYIGETRVSLLNSYHATETDRKEDALKAYLSNDDKNFRLQNIEKSGFDDRNAPLQIDYGFELDNQITQVGNEMYVSIDYEKDFKNFAIELDKRQYDYAFPYKIARSYEIALQIPDGYKVSYLPENYKKTHPDFEFDISFEQQPGKVLYRKTLALKNARIRKADFEEWNETIKAVKNLYDDRIILEKGQ